MTAAGWENKSDARVDDDPVLGGGKFRLMSGSMGSGVEDGGDGERGGVRG